MSSEEIKQTEKIKPIIENQPVSVGEVEKSAKDIVGFEVEKSLKKNEEIDVSETEGVDKVTQEAGVEIKNLKNKTSEALKEIDQKEIVSIDPIEYFNGDKEAMMKHFRTIDIEYPAAMPVENSVVRIEQQNEILKNLEAGVSVVIEAHKRQGKTSMLKSLGNEWKKRNGTEPVFIDMNKEIFTYENTSPEEFKNIFGKRYVEKFIRKNFSQIKDEDVKKEMEGKTPFEALDALAIKEGKQILLEIDELTDLAKKDDGRVQLLTENLKNLKNVNVLVAWHPFDTYAAQAEVAFKDYKKESIKPLNNDDAKKLIERPLKDLGSDVSFSDEAIQKIYDYAGGRPMDMNNFCKCITNGNNLKPIQKMRYERKDIEDFINKNDLYRASSAEVSFTAICDDIPKIYKFDLNKEHKDTIDRIMESGGSVSTSEIAEKNATDLVNIGLIKKDEKNNLYKINGELTFSLLKEQIENSQSS